MEPKNDDGNEPVADASGDDAGFSLDQVFGSDPIATTPDLSPVTNQDTAPSASVEPDPPATEDKAPSAKEYETPPVEEGKTTEPAAPDGKPVPKHERDLFKQREKRREVEAKLAEVQKQNAELKERLGEEPDPAPVEPDPITVAVFQERLRISKERFMANHEDGAKLIDERLAGEDSPWVEIEKKAADGDVPSQILKKRMLDSLDPLEEALAILNEQDLFKAHGTSSVTELVDKLVAEKTKDIEQAVLAKLKKNGQRPKVDVPVTLGQAPGQGGGSPAAPEEVGSFSVGSYFDDD